MKKSNKTIDSNISPYQKEGNACSYQGFDEKNFDSKATYLQNNFVFIQKNQIKRRIESTNDNFTIAETGFGTGLNFLLTLQAYQKLQQDSLTNLAPLHFISVEKYPLSKVQLTKALSLFPQLAEHSSALIQNYPDTTSDKLEKSHQATFLNEQVCLTLIFDDAATGLSCLSSPKNGLVDAWFLEGSSADKPLGMWDESLFSQLAKIIKRTSDTDNIDG